MLASSPSRHTEDSALPENQSLRLQPLCRAPLSADYGQDAGLERRFHVPDSARR